MTAIVTQDRDARTLAAVAEQFSAESDERIAQLTARVTAIKTAKRDAVVDTNALRAVAMPATDNAPARVVLTVPTQQHIGNITVGDVAHDQFSARLKINRDYYQRMITEAPELLATNLNWWLTNTPEQRLLRMLTPTALDEPQRAVMAASGAGLHLRAVLGKGYRTIDDADLVDAILPTLRERGALLQDFSIDERRMHAKFMNAPRSVADIRQQYAQKYNLTPEQVARHTHVNGVDVSWVNEVLSTGVYIRHSEIGFASLSASFVERILKCLNDYVAENTVSIRHVGGKNGDAGDDVRFISDTTRVMEDGALLSRVQDSITDAFSDKQVLDRATKLLAAKVEKVERPADAPLFDFVGNIGVGLGLTDANTELLKQETMRAVMEEGGETRFAFVQGITATARQMTNYDDRTELERTGFRLLHDDASALLKVARDAERNAKKRKN